MLTLERVKKLTSHNATIDDDEFIIKTIIVGCEGSGKTSLVERYIVTTFPIKPIHTVALTCYNKIIEKNNKKINLQIVDSTGTNKYMDMVLNSFINTKYAVICYDLSNLKSWEQAKEWIRAIRTKNNCKLILCGTKLDLLNFKDRTLRQSIVATYTLGLQLPYFETSAKLGENIVELFEFIIEDFFNDLVETKSLKAIQMHFEVEETKPEEEKKCQSCMFCNIL